MYIYICMHPCMHTYISTTLCTTSETMLIHTDPNTHLVFSITSLCYTGTYVTYPHIHRKTHTTRNVHHPPPIPSVRPI